MTTIDALKEYTRLAETWGIEILAIEVPSSVYYSLLSDLRLKDNSLFWDTQDNTALKFSVYLSGRDRFLEIKKNIKREINETEQKIEELTNYLNKLKGTEDRYLSGIKVKPIKD